MAKEIKITDFVYPGCIIVANTSAKAVSGNYPEIARVFHDRRIEWCRKRITQQMREHVEALANEPFIEQFYQGPNFFACPPTGK